MNAKLSTVLPQPLASGLLAMLLLGLAGVGASASSTTAKAWFDQPLSGSHLSMGLIDVTTHATSPDGIEEVTLSVDGIQIASLAFQPARLVTAQFQWQPDQAKGYTLTARGRSGDAWGEPATVFVIVGPGPHTGASPTPGAVTSACQPEPTFAQDFSSDAGSFDTFDFGDVAAQVTGGAYHLTFTESGTITTSQAHENFGDVCVEADVVDVGPDRSGRFGVFCRLSEEGTYYEFFVDSSGRAGTRVGSFLTGTASQQPAYFDTAAVNSGLGAVNRIRAECIGSTLSMWVNGQLVGSFQDSSQSAGDVGVFASTAGADPASGRFDVSFDNVTIATP